jgi:site-specific DNA-cytosine methylase
MEVVDYLRPSIVLMENVPDMARWNDGAVLLGVHLEDQVIGAAAEGERDHRCRHPGGVAVRERRGEGVEGAFGRVKVRERPEVLDHLKPGKRTRGQADALSRDLESLELARQNTADAADRIRFHHGEFSTLHEALRENGIDQVDGLLADRFHGARALSRADHDDDANNAFNKMLVGQNPGRYSLCATSHGVEGCQHAEVVAGPRR